jgi:hypothetical protein
MPAQEVAAESHPFDSAQAGSNVERHDVRVGYPASKDWLRSMGRAVRGSPPNSR